jgi:hypothetical protein
MDVIHCGLRCTFQNAVMRVTPGICVDPHVERDHNEWRGAQVASVFRKSIFSRELCPQPQGSVDTHIHKRRQLVGHQKKTMASEFG